MQGGVLLALMKGLNFILLNKNEVFCKVPKNFQSFPCFSEDTLPAISLCRDEELKYQWSNEEISTLISTQALGN